MSDVFQSSNTLSGDDKTSISVDQVKDADSTATFTPIVQLDVLDESELEKQTEILYSHRALLYRFIPKDGDTPAKWIVRGKGNIKIAQDKTSKKVNMMMHMEKTLRTCLNCVILPSMTLKANAGSDRSWLFNTIDYADFDEPGVAKKGIFLVKFKTKEIADDFKTKLDQYKKFNAQGTVTEEEGTEANTNEPEEEEAKEETKKEEETKEEEQEQ